MNYVQIKVNTKLGKIEQGKVIKVEADINGIPLDAYWRKRLKDAEIDNCCSLVMPDTEPSKGKKVKNKVSSDT